VRTAPLAGGRWYATEGGQALHGRAIDGIGDPDVELSDERIYQEVALTPRAVSVLPLMRDVDPIDIFFPEGLTSDSASFAI
jgi:hypothetical protein